MDAFLHQWICTSHLEKVKSFKQIKNIVVANSNDAGVHVLKELAKGLRTDALDCEIFLTPKTKADLIPSSKLS